LHKFNFVFSGDARTDALNICYYIDEYYVSLGLMAAEIDLSKMMGVVSGMVQDFPHPLGIADSSPFKKAASFTASFAAERPLLTPLPEPIYGKLHKTTRMQLSHLNYPLTPWRGRSCTNMMER